jgi:hypothetical protein
MFSTIPFKNIPVIVSKKHRLKTSIIAIALILIGIFIGTRGHSQMITGVWKGKIKGQKAEVKIILHGDSLTGTSYYYESASAYRRYSIKGYFDAETNEAVWWDDQLIEEKTGRSRSIPGSVPLLARADFNCPGDGRMMLDGKAGNKEENPKSDLHLDKTENRIFRDEWDYVIDNYLVGANDPDVIDSISLIAYQKPVIVTETKTVTAPPVVVEKSKPVQKVPEPVAIKEEKPAPVVTIKPPQTIEEKFITRKKVFVTEIPVSGDSIELRFYDNAEIDGDSISLFLNNKLIFQHIRLLASPYIIKLAVHDLDENNELIMVAENLGSIPPNTSYMVAEVANKRYEALLASTEGSSAMIRLVKAKPD